MPRSRYVYRPGHPLANERGFVDAALLTDVAAPAALMVFGEAHYDGMRATDGTPIDTRKKHREYMKANNLTTADDFKESWPKAVAELEQRRAGVVPKDPERREIIGRATYESEKRGRR